MQGKTCTIETADILLKYFELTIFKKLKKKATDKKVLTRGAKGKI
jgi:hypothetical protein